MICHRCRDGIFTSLFMFLDTFPVCALIGRNPCFLWLLRHFRVYRPFRKTLCFMIFLTCFATICRMDFGCVSASLWVQIKQSFGINFHGVLKVFFDIIWMVNRASGVRLFLSVFLPFSSCSQWWCSGRSLGSFWHPLGSMWVALGTLLCFIFHIPDAAIILFRTRVHSTPAPKQYFWNGSTYLFFWYVFLMW